MSHPVRIALLPLLMLVAAASVADRQAEAAGARIVVTGSAEVSAPPDRAGFTLEIGTSGREADAVLDENARRAARMLEALRSTGIGLERLQTRGVHLQPEWTPRPRDAEPDWRPTIAGYRASNRIEVETAALDRVGELLAVAVEAGANGVDGIRFRLEDETAAREAAIRRATAKALHEARVVAEAAGTRVSAVRELRLDHASATPSAPMLQGRMEMAMDAAVRALPVEPGEILVHASVTVTLDAPLATPP
ncbi:MAG: SIMPL domain-containing protein [Pseudomonadales bacterium]|jgi:uncharacterized protein YggE|nr:SIMPL domain-containing protein [Pseudomonadales bacterium]